MKAIKQIIDYLRERGELDRAQLTELASLGFLPWHEVYAAELEREPEPAAVTLAPEADGEAVFPEPAGRRGRGRKPRAADLTERELAAHLAAFFAAAAPRLAGLVRLAGG